MDSFFYGDRTKWAEMTLRSQVSVTAQSVAAETQFLKKWINSLAKDDGIRKIDWQNSAPYFAAGIMQKSASAAAATGAGAATAGVTGTVAAAGAASGSWILKEFSVDPKSEWASVTKDNFQAQLYAMNLSLDQSVSFYASVDSQKKASVITFVPMPGQVWFFIHGGETFQSVLDSQKGSLISLGVVTKEALTIAHTNSDYVGQKLSKSPFQEELVKLNAVSGSGTYNLSNKDNVYVYYQKISDLDAFVYASIPVEELMKGRKKLAMQLVLMSIGLILVLSAFILRLTKKSQSDEIPLSDFAHPISDLMSQPTSAKIKNEKSIEVIHDKAVLQKEKISAYGKMASAIGHELKTPLLAILGYGQSLHSKNMDPDAKKILEALISEARSSRSIIDKILSFAGENIQERSLMKLEVPLLRALKNLDPLFQQKKIQITKDFHETPPIYINCDNLILAFENILTNCIESMDKMPNKEIEIRLQDLGSKIELLIKDKGEGILEENISKVFEPFFTTKSSQQKIGLGLSVSHGVLKEHSAAIEVSSKVGEGTNFIISFEKAASLVKANPVEEKIQSLQASRPRRLKTDEIKLDIKKYDEIQLKNDEDLVGQNKSDVGTDSEGKTNVVDTTESEDLKLNLGAEVTNTSKILRKPSDVDVEELLEMPGKEMTKVKADEDKTVLTDSGNYNLSVTGVASATDSLIGPPKKNSTVKSTQMDQYKVNVRRPERKS